MRAGPHLIIREPRLIIKVAPLVLAIKERRSLCKKRNLRYFGCEKAS